MATRTGRVGAAIAAAVCWAAASTTLVACTGSADPTAAPTGRSLSTDAVTNPSPPVTSTRVDAELDELAHHAAVLVPHYDLIVPGGIVLVAERGEVRQVAFGDARLHPREPMRPDARFPLASNSKTMLATVVLQLVQEGRLALGDTVDRWKPGLLAAGEDVTVADLLSMRSGLSDPITRRGFDLGTELTDARLHDLLQGPLTAPPGTRSRYSNANYAVLGRIVEAVTGRSLAAVLRDRIFRPAAMAHAHVATDLRAEPDLQHGYDERHRDATPRDISAVFGAGQVVGTIADLAAFYRALFDGDLLPRDVVADMTRPRGTLPRGGPGYGLGTMTFDLQCGRAVGHAGELGGFESLALHDPRTGRTVIAMVNQRGDLAIDAISVLAINLLCY